MRTQTHRRDLPNRQRSEPLRQEAPRQGIPNSSLLSILESTQQDPNAARASMQAAVDQEHSRPLDLSRAMRDRINHSFGYDLSQVRLVQSDLPARMGADAVAQGDLIRFAPGAFSQDEKGQKLLYHELAHVVQQSLGYAMAGEAGMPVYDPAAEQAADTSAHRAMDGHISDSAVQPLSIPSVTQTPMVGNRMFTRLRQLFSSSRHRDQPAAQAGTAAEDITQAQLGKNRDNPTQDPALEEKLSSIRSASSLDQAQENFSIALGKPLDGTISQKVSLGTAKRRLLPMARMAHDFPQLQDQISGFGLSPEGTMMSTEPTFEFGKASSPINWSDRHMKGGLHRMGRALRRVRGAFSGLTTSSRRYDGVHEMGHMVNAKLVEQAHNDPEKYAESQFPEEDMAYAMQEDWGKNQTAQDLLQQAIQQVAGQDSKQGRMLQQYIQDHGVEGEDSTKRLDLSNDKEIFDPKKRAMVRDAGTTQYKHRQALHRMGLTSKYGATDAGEMFAEAFSDVYSKGEKASPLSRELVRLSRQRLAKQG